MWCTLKASLNVYWKNKLIVSIFTIEECLCIYLVDLLSYTVLHDLLNGEGVVRVLRIMLMFKYYTAMSFISNIF